MIFDLTGDCSLEDAAEFLRLRKTFSADPQYVFIVRDSIGRYLRSFYGGRAHFVHIQILALGFTELRTALSFGENWQRVSEARCLPIRIHHIHQPPHKLEVIGYGKTRRAEQIKPFWRM